MRGQLVNGSFDRSIWTWDTGRMKFASEGKGTSCSSSLRLSNVKRPMSHVKWICQMTLEPITERPNDSIRGMRTL